MKKLLAILLAAATLSLAACGGTVAHVANIEDKKPWAATGTGSYEKCVYDIERRDITRSGDDQIIATGTYTTEVEVESDERTVVSASFTLTYVDDERAGSSRGLTDTYVAACAFATTGAHPIYSYRAMTLAPRADETRNNSYTIVANYASAEAAVPAPSGDVTLPARTSRITWHGESADLAIDASGQVFDNEQLYYILRAFTNIDEEKSETFRLSNLFDAHNAGSFSAHDMSVSVAENRETLFVSPDFIEYSTTSYNDRGEAVESIELDGNEDNPRAKLDCLVGTVGMTSSNPGPSQMVYFSDIPFRVDDVGNTTTKVIVRIVTREYSGASEQYNMIYHLKEYSVLKENGVSA